MLRMALLNCAWHSLVINHIKSMLHICWNKMLISYGTLLVWIRVMCIFAGKNSSLNQFNRQFGGVKLASCLSLINSQLMYWYFALQWCKEHGNRRKKYFIKYHQDQGKYERKWSSAIHQEDGDTKEILSRCMELKESSIIHSQSKSIHKKPFSIKKICNFCINLLNERVKVPLNFISLTFTLILCTKKMFISEKIYL